MHSPENDLCEMICFALSNFVRKCIKSNIWRCVFRNIYLNVQSHLQSGLFYVKITHFVDQKNLGCCLSAGLEVKGKKAFVRNSLRCIV
jgi:hypothetical protein